MEDHFDIERLTEFLQQQSPATKIYIGGDSERLMIKGVWYVDYTVVVVVHVDGCKGCRIFGEITRERDYDSNKSKPTTRLMMEVQKVSELYLKVAPLLDPFEVEIHLDLNPHKEHASNLVVQQAIGYIRGVTNITPKIKPNAWAASYCADRLKEVRENTRNPKSIADLRVKIDHQSAKAKKRDMWKKIKK